MAGRDIAIGDHYAVVCPPQGSTGSGVWGTDVYTDDSSVCAAAVHADLVSSRDGGTVVVEILPGRPEYAGSERHGVTTESWGDYSRSFQFVVPDDEEEDDEDGEEDEEDEEQEDEN